MDDETNEVERPIQMAVDRFLLARAEAAEEATDMALDVIARISIRLTELGVRDPTLQLLVAPPALPTLWSIEPGLKRTRARAAVRELLEATAGAVDSGDLRPDALQSTPVREVSLQRIGLALLALTSDLLTSPPDAPPNR